MESLWPGALLYTEQTRGRRAFIGSAFEGNAPSGECTALARVVGIQPFGRWSVANAGEDGRRREGACWGALGGGAGQAENGVRRQDRLTDAPRLHMV